VADDDRRGDDEPGWQFACSLDVVGQRSIVPLRVEGKAIILIQTPDRFYAAERMCPHEGADLAQGVCRNGRLFCPHHAAFFELADEGRISPGWPARDLRLYPTQVLDRNVWIKVGLRKPEQP
jgi:3-phenylpropionate/trans-cinnamate dioxygenase ferredoxin component